MLGIRKMYPPGEAREHHGVDDFRTSLSPSLMSFFWVSSYCHELQVGLRRRDELRLVVSHIY